MILTPIRATIHYDDIEKQWHFKASRQEQNGPTDFKPWFDLIGDAATLASLLITLLDFWASTGSTVNAPLGNMRALAALIGPREGTYTEEVADFVTVAPDFPGNTFEADPYDGATDSWGTTAP